MSETPKTKRIGKWYFGGLASAGAACCTHPLDLLKVHLQTQQKADVGLLRMGVKVVKNEGILGLYNGLSASLLRQATYSTTRFAIYEVVKKELTENGRVMPFYEKVLLAGVAGATGGFLGTPGDMVNVRMQNDMKVPKEQRRNYKHAGDGLYRVIKEEGPKKIFSGATMASSRAVLVTIGQLSFYDQIKQTLLASKYFDDNLSLHFTSSFCAGAIATLITQPLDVMKTRFMNAKPGQYNSLVSCAKDIAHNGPMGFFKGIYLDIYVNFTMADYLEKKKKFLQGFVPAFVRLGPHTIITFIFFEQLRLRFGVDVPE